MPLRTEDGRVAPHSVGLAGGMCRRDVQWREQETSRRDLISRLKVRRPTSSPRTILAVLVIVSVAVRIAAARTLDAPWIAPDEFIYALSGESFWSTGSLTLFGAA